MRQALSVSKGELVLAVVVAEQGVGLVPEIEQEICANVFPQNSQYTVSYMTLSQSKVDITVM